MGLTLQEVLGTALKKLEGSSFLRFTEKLSVWEVRKGYIKIPNDELLGKDPEQLAGLINKYYKYAYGAEVTLAVLLKIKERSIREKLQHDLKEVDIAGQGLGTSTFTDRVNFVQQHKVELITRIKDVDPVLRDIRHHLLTEDQYNDVMEKKTSEKKMRELCDIISHWEETGKYKVYRALWKYNEKIIKNMEMEDWMRKNSYIPFIRNRVNFISHHRVDLIWKTEIDSVLHDLKDESLLSEEQYNIVMKKKTSPEKMRELSDIISHWTDTGKYTAYIILRKYNEEVIRYLEIMDFITCNDHLLYFRGMLDFIEHHRSDLIRWMRNVDPVVHDLHDQYLLTEEQYNAVMEKTTSKEKTIELCDIISHWEDREKYKAYIILREHNEEIITYLEMKNKTSSDDHSLSFMADETSFIDPYRLALIWRIKDINPILHNFRNQELLTPEQYDDVMKNSSPMEKMRKLCDIISHWEDTGKILAYIILRKHNEEIIKVLEMMDRWRSGVDHTVLFIDKTNFIERHRSTLMRRIRNEYRILHDLQGQGLLTAEQYNDLMKKRPSQEKMRELFDIINEWEDTKKIVAYTVLKKYNEEVIATLEMEDWEMKHIYQQQLFIRDIIRPEHLTASDTLSGDWGSSVIRPQGWSPTSSSYQRSSVIRRQGWSPTSSSYQHFGMPQYQGASKTSSGDRYFRLNKTNVLPRISSKVCDDDKPWARGESYKSLQDWDQVVTKKASKDTDLSLSQSQDAASKTSEETAGISLSQSQDAASKSAENKTGISLSQSQDAASKSAENKTKRKRRRRNKPKSAASNESKSTEVSHVSEKPPQSRVEMTVDEFSCKLCGKEKDQEQELAEPVSTVGSMYRLELKSPGLYRCQKTGIKFLVEGPVIIEYKPESWSDHLNHVLDNYEILGPLFNIKISGDPGAVSAVHLPHFLCLKGFNEDTALIKCAHFQDGNMMLIKPMKIDPFYIIVENPTFSCLGPLLPFRKKKIPIHGIVLIYFKIMCKGAPAEEYRIHLYVLPHTINAEENLDKENKKFGFRRIKKPEQTIDNVYTKVKYLVTTYPGVSICPETVKFQSERYNYTEIQLQEKDVDIFLYASEKNSEDPVWKVHLTKSDIDDLTELLSQLTICEGAGGPPRDPSDHFLDIHRGDLISLITTVDPVLDDLLSQKLITREQYKTVSSKPTTQEKMRKLYDYISNWERVNKDKVIAALKKENPSSRIWKEESL